MLRFFFVSDKNGVAKIIAAEMETKEPSELIYMGIPNCLIIGKDLLLHL